MIEKKILQLQGPILILGASGFIGANLFRRLTQYRSDIFGTTSKPSPWRLIGMPETNILISDLLVDFNLHKLLDITKPRTVIDCIAFGGYSFQKDPHLIFRTNVSIKIKLIEELRQRNILRYIHAGSSSEYGDAASGRREECMLTPNSHYAASKAAISDYLYFVGKKLNFPCANLRLYSVFGPYEDSARLIPSVIAMGVKGCYPPFVQPDISRDFLYIEDACEAFVDTALNLKECNYGESFNIGTGIKTSIREIASLSREIFTIKAEPRFTMPNRDWDLSDWYANTEKANTCLNWKARVSLRDGLLKTIAWYKLLDSVEKYERSSKQYGMDTVYSVSAIVACYKDAQAIPIMYTRLSAIFAKLNIDYEIIFINDASPDDSEEVIRSLSAGDRKVIGITHSRNFGSQAAFRSGMQLSTKNSCILLDGDLQDPPELIERFVEKWREGFEVVYGRRVKREAPLYMQIAYKMFYRVFDKFSYIQIPHDAGDFSLMDKSVVRSLLQFPERDLFVRGIRAYAGFKQTGVDYVRPERMFGVSTNNLMKNINWAKKGILAFSNTPLSLLTVLGTVLFVISALLSIAEIAIKLIFPALTPRGITTTILLVTFFGSINLFALGIIGEYIAKILEEVKRRPHFIRRNIIRDGEIRHSAIEAADAMTKLRD